MRWLGLSRSLLVLHCGSTSGCSRSGWIHCITKRKTMTTLRVALCSSEWNLCTLYSLEISATVSTVFRSATQTPYPQDTSLSLPNQTCYFPPYKIFHFPIDYQYERKSSLPLSSVWSTHSSHECNSVPLHWNDECDCLCSCWYVRDRRTFSYSPIQKSLPHSFLTLDGSTMIWCTSFSTWTSVCTPPSKKNIK